jgi:hypothetical protein
MEVPPQGRRPTVRDQLVQDEFRQRSSSGSNSSQLFGGRGGRGRGSSSQRGRGSGRGHSGRGTSHYRPHSPASDGGQESKREPPTSALQESDSDSDSMPSLCEKTSSDEDSGEDTFLAEAATSNQGAPLGGRRQLRPPRHLPVIRAASFFAPSTSLLPTDEVSPANLPGTTVDTLVDFAGPDEGELIIDDGAIVLRGDVESDDESQISLVYWDTTDLGATPPDYGHDWEGDSSDASVSNIPATYELVDGAGGRVRHSDLNNPAFRTLQAHYVRVARRNEAREGSALRIIPDEIAFAETTYPRAPPRPADGGMFFGPPGPTPPTSDTSEPWDSDEQWGSVRDASSHDAGSDRDSDRAVSSSSSATEESVAHSQPTRGSEPRVWEPPPDFQRPRGPSPGSRPEIPQHRTVRRRRDTDYRYRQGGMPAARPAPDSVAPPGWVLQDPLPAPARPWDFLEGVDLESKNEEVEDVEIPRWDAPAPRSASPSSITCGIHSSPSSVEAGDEDIPEEPTSDDEDSTSLPKLLRGSFDTGAEASGEDLELTPLLTHEEHARMMRPILSSSDDCRDCRAQPVQYFAKDSVFLDSGESLVMVGDHGADHVHTALAITEDYCSGAFDANLPAAFSGDLCDYPTVSSSDSFGILDSGATCTILTGDTIDLFDGGSLHALTSMTVNTASRGGSLRINAVGSIGAFPEIYYADRGCRGPVGKGLSGRLPCRERNAEPSRRTHH